MTKSRFNGKIIWGIDPGSSTCGIVRLDSGRIGECFECEPRSVYSEILRLSNGLKFVIAIEDIFPFQMRLTPSVIATCKLIGGISKEFEIKNPEISIEYIARNTIKNWIFKSFPDIAIPIINRKILSKDVRIKEKFIELVLSGDAKIEDMPAGMTNKDGKLREPSFNYVDDRVVIASMKKLFNIEYKRGVKNPYNLTKDSHAWQALAVAACHYHAIKNSSENNQ